jgi:hypothetical protein
MATRGKPMATRGKPMATQQQPTSNILIACLPKKNKNKKFFIVRGWKN